MGTEILKKILPMIIVPVIVKVFVPIKKIYQKFSAKFANSFHEYDKPYRERHGTIKVFCVGMHKPIPLDDVYVTVQLLDPKSASKYGSLENIRKVFRAKYEPIIPRNPNEPQDSTKVANNKQYLMVLGGPGVGKSTFLRKVGLEALKKKEGNFAHECIPVFLELKRFTGDPIDIEALIIEEFKTCGYSCPEEMTKTALESGKLLILFDGLDEVPAANVDNVVRKIGDFVDQYSQNRFIASCRIAAYKGGFTRFTEVEIAEFDDSQVKAYISNWFASVSDSQQRQLDERRDTAKKCWQALNEPQHGTTKELAWNPLLLTLLCMVYDELRNFPRNRADLYEKALNIFLKKWAAEKGLPQDLAVDQYLDTLTEKQLLYEIAAKNLEADRLFLREDELMDQIKEFNDRSTNIPSTFDASKILEIIVAEQGLIVEKVSGIYSFFHLTFQEYLTANYFVRNTSLIQRLMTTHLHHVEWKEVFLMTAGLMHEADNLLVEMKGRSSDYINTDRLKSLFRWAKRIINTSDERYQGATKRAFAIRQYFSLWMLNKIHEDVKNIASRNRDLYQDFGSYNKLEFCFYFDRQLYRDLYQGLYQNQDLLPRFYVQRLLDLYPDTALYDDLDQVFGFDYRDPDLYFYEDFYRYVDTDSYPSIFSKFSNRFDKELGERIALVERMEQAKIFNGVDLQRMIQKFNEQREFIKAVGEGQSVKPPEESIHDAWLSVLGITDDMLAISSQELKSYVYFLRAMQCIVECNAAAGRVTPEIREQIRNWLLNWDVEDTEG